MKHSVKLIALGSLLALASNVHALVIVGGPATSSPFSPTLANGNFEADSGSPLAFNAVTNWHNIEGDDASVNFGQTGGMAGSPEASSQGAFIFGQMAGNDTGYTVAAAGETFDIDFYANRFGGGWNGNETYDVVLFTSASGVDASTGLGDINILSTTNFSVQAGWQNYTQDGIYATTAGDVGQTVYLGMDFTDPDGTRFPRIDVITWEVNPVPEPAAGSLGILCAFVCLAIRRVA